MISAVLCAAVLGSLAPLSSPAATQYGSEQEKAVDKEHMLEIWKALMAFVDAKGKAPDNLSDLVPDYLPDAKVLLSPAAKRIGKSPVNSGYVDPKLPCSYVYQFNGLKFFGSPVTFREFKEAQMQEFGAVVPILRCFYYKRVLNVSYSGDFFESGLFWQDSPEAKNIVERLGLGEGFKDGEFVAIKVVDAKTGEAVPEATLQLTARTFHRLPLPDRTLKTDENGIARIPLGLAKVPGRSVFMTLSAENYQTIKQRWTPEAANTEKVLKLQPTKRE